jgi:hypothetical protein
MSNRSHGANKVVLSQIAGMDLERLRLNNFRLAYHDLEDRVRVGLRAQAGNVAALRDIREQCITLLATAQTVRW